MKFSITNETDDTPFSVAGNLTVGEFFTLSKNSKQLLLCVDDSTDVQYLVLGDQGENIRYFDNKNTRIYYPQEVHITFKM